MQPLESSRNLSECLHQAILTEQNSLYFFNKMSNELKNNNCEYRT